MTCALTPEERAELAHLAQTRPAVAKLMRRKVQYAMIVDGIFDIGIYCKAVVYPDGHEIKRTDWEDGHNTAVMAVSDIIVRRLR